MAARVVETDEQDRLNDLWSLVLYMRGLLTDEQRELADAKWLEILQQREAGRTEKVA